MTTKATGGSGNLSYQYEINSEVVKAFSTSNKFTWTPTKAGDYTIKVTVKDSKGTISIETLSYKITEPIQEENLEITSIKVDKEIGVVGSEVKITAIVEGSEDVVYAVSVHEIADGWKKVKDYSENNVTSWTPSKAGIYKIWIDAKDSNNNKTSKYIEYTVK